MGIEASKGKYLAFVDSDDYVHPQYIEILYNSIKNHDADVSVCRCKTVKEDVLGVVGNNIYCCEEMEFDNEKERLSYLIGPGVVAWNKLYKRSIFDNIRFPVGRLHEDCGIIWKLIYYAPRMIFLKNELYYYYTNEKGITRSSYTMKHMDKVEVLYEQYEYFKNKNEKYAGMILQACLDSYPNIYYRLRNNGGFDKKNKKLFLNNYRSKVKKGVLNKNITIVCKTKHIIFSSMPIAMYYIYNLQHKYM